SVRAHDEDQTLLPQPGVVDAYAPVSGGALHGHRAPRSARKQRAFVKDRGDVHEPAGPEKCLLSREVRMTTGAVYVDQLVLSDAARRLLDDARQGLLVLLDDPFQHLGDVGRVLLEHGAFLSSVGSDPQKS